MLMASRPAAAVAEAADPVPSPIVRRSPLPRWLLVSLLLHAAVVLPLRAWQRPPPAAPVAAPLVLELDGLVSERQVAAQQAAPAAPARTAAAPAERPVPAPVPKAVPDRRPPVAKAIEPSRALPARSDGPREANSPVAAAPEAPAPEPAATAPVAGAAGAAGAEQSREAQTLKAPPPSEADALRAWLAELRRAVQRHLVHPGELAGGAAIGEPAVRFALAADGTLVPGSLVLEHSSGQPALDEEALHAVRDAAPFSPPPRPMRVKLSLSFDEER